MKSYIGTKIVKAEPMSSSAFAKEKNPLASDAEVGQAGYKVVYEDGYISWSPKDVFERCYREITPLEKGLITQSDVLLVGVSK